MSELVKEYKGMMLIPLSRIETPHTHLVLKVTHIL